VIPTAQSDGIDAYEHAPRPLLELVGYGKTSELCASLMNAVIPALRPGQAETAATQTPTARPAPWPGCSGSGCRTWPSIPVQLQSKYRQVA
jgi:hypothetical protein